MTLSLSFLSEENFSGKPKGVPFPANQCPKIMLFLGNLGPVSIPNLINPQEPWNLCIYVPVK